MIKIVARSTVRPECIEQYQALARELVEKSQAEAGNISVRDRTNETVQAELDDFIGKITHEIEAREG